MKTLNRILLLVVLQLCPAVALAASLTVQVDFWDNREDRGSGTGALLPESTDETNQPVKSGLYVGVWDQDGSCRDFNGACGESDDNLLALYTTNSSGKFTYSSLPTSDPGGSGTADIYLVTEYETWDFQIYDASSNVPVSYSRTKWNYGGGTVNWNVSCPDDSYNVVDGHCDNTSDVLTNFPDEQDWALLAATLMDMWARFTSASLEPNGHNNQMEIYVATIPSSSGSCGSTVTCNSGGTSCGYDAICIDADFSDRNHLVAHEVGHLMHRRSLDVSGTLGSGTCSGDFDSADPNEKCATSEGWASFTAGATYYDNSAASPYFYNSTWVLEGDVAGGASCYGSSGTYQDFRGNVARFFWDLFDDTTVDDGSSDNTTWYHGSGLTDTWTRFDAGTGDREASESGANGRNSWDFWANEQESGDAGGEIWLNCLSGSEFN